MLLVYVAAASLAVGLLRGGRFRYFSQTPFYGLWLPILAFGLEAAIGPLVTAIPGSPDRWLWLVVLGEYLLLAAFLWCNRHLKPIWLLAAGTVANFAVISLNQWKMPVSRAILEMPQLSEFVEKMTTGTLVEYALITDSTRTDRY